MKRLRSCTVDRLCDRLRNRLDRWMSARLGWRLYDRLNEHTWVPSFRGDK